jgi:hypothetical protein
MPSFSMVARSASIAEPVFALATKAATAGSAAAATLASGCSGATATKVTPMIVSARVVNTLRRPWSTRLPSAPVIACENAKRTPSERPIQLLCIRRTRSGQPSSRLTWSSNSCAYSVMRK